MDQPLKTEHPEELEEIVRRELALLYGTLCADLGVFAPTFLNGSPLLAQIESALRRAFVCGEACEGVQRGLDSMAASNNLYRGILAGIALGSEDRACIAGTRKMLEVDQ